MSVVPIFSILFVGKNKILIKFKPIEITGNNRL